MKNDEKAAWAELGNFGDALIVAYGSDVRAEGTMGGIVPIGSVVVTPDQEAMGILKEALANDDTTREGVVTLLSDLLDTDLSSGRTQLDVLLKEEDVEVEVESDHPHSEAQDMFKTLTFKGAEKVEVVFADETKTSDGAYVKFYKDDAHNATWGDDRYYGSKENGNWPGLNSRAPLTIPSNTFIVHFHASTPSPEYGFKLIAKAHTIEKTFPPAVPPPRSEALLAAFKASGTKALSGLISAGSPLLPSFTRLCGKLVKESLRVVPKTVRQGGDSKQVVKESAHPYPHNVNSSETMSFKGAKKLIITFDSKTRTENGCDYVCFYKDDTNSEMWGEKYSGGKDGSSSNWPGLKGFPPLVIESNKFTLHFRTDGSVNDWGWKFTVKIITDEFDMTAIPLHEMATSLKYGLGSLSEGFGTQAYPEVEEIAVFEKKIERKESKDRRRLSSEGGELDGKSETLQPVVFSDEKVSASGGGKEPPSATNPVKFVTVPVSTNVLATAAAGGVVLATLPAKSVVNVVGEAKGEWLEVVTDGNTGYVLRRTDDTEHLTMLGEESDMSGSDGLSIADLELTDVVAKDTKPKLHPVWTVLDSCSAESTEIDNMFGNIPSQGLRGMMEELESFTTCLSHLLSIKYAQMSLTSLIPMMSLSSQFDLNDVSSMLEFLRIVFMNQKDVEMSDELLAVKVKVKELVEVCEEEAGENLKEREAAAESLAVNSLNVIRNKMKVEEMMPPITASRKVVETTHNYPDNADKYWRVTIEGAKRMMISFDERSSTETDCDYVTIYQGSERRTVLGGPYSGRKNSSEKNFPGVNRKPLWVDGNDIEIYFHSDSSNNDWGVKINIWGILEAPTKEDVKKCELEIARLNCTPASVAFSCWMLGVLSPLKSLSGLMLSAESLRILRAYLKVCKEEEEKSKIISIVSSLLDNADKSRADSFEEVKKIVKVVTGMTSEEYARSGSVGNSQLLQSLMECSVKGIDLVGNYGWDGLEVPKWVGWIGDCRKILQSFESRTVPTPLILREYLPKLVKDNTINLHASASSTVEEHSGKVWTIEKANSVVVKFEGSTVLPPNSVITVEGGGKKRVLKGLVGATEMPSDSGVDVHANDLVVVGKDWKWGAAEEGEGTVMAICKWKDEPGKGVRVKWASGNESLYRYGYRGKYDVEVVGENDKSTKAIVMPGNSVTLTVDPGEEGEAGKSGKDFDWKGAFKFEPGITFNVPYREQEEFNADFSTCMWFKAGNEDEVLTSTSLFARKYSMDGMNLIQFDVILVNASTFNVVMGNAEMVSGISVGGQGVKVGIWNHVALTVGGEDVSVFLNGTMVGREKFVGTRMGAPMGGDMVVGSEFEGYIWNLKAWNRCLTEAEVKAEGEFGALEVGSTGAFQLLVTEEAGEVGRWMGASKWDAEAEKIGGGEEEAKKEYSWKCSLIPVYDVDSVGKEEMQKLRKEYCVSTLKHDEALVKYANEICVKKMLDTSSILRVGWEDISPVKEDLTRSPLLRDLSVLEAGVGEGTLKPILARWKIIQLFNRTLHSALSLIDLSNCKREGSLALLVSRNRRLIFRSLKLPMWEMALSATANNSDSMFELKMSRSRASKNIRNYLTDNLGRWSCFGQAFRQMHSIPPHTLRRAGQLYNTTFMGERAHDAGGPYRETYCEYAAEMMSTALPLFLPSPNGRHSVGQNRDAYVPNPDTSGGAHRLDMYAFAGKIFGICVRSKDYLNLSLPSIVWKRLCNEEVNVDDLEAIDVSFVKSMESIRKIHEEGVDSETFGDIIFETFETLRSDDEKVELIEGGRDIDVSFENREEFVDLAIKFRLGEFDIMLDAICRGFSTVVPQRQLCLFSWEEVAQMVVGSPTIDIALLRSATEYSGCSAEDKHVKFFWQALKEFNQEERRAFLRFTWSRTTLPLNKDAFPQRFKLQSCGLSPADSYYPIAHTCFFSLELPAYSSLEITKDKLRYAAFNCSAIDGDDTDVGIAAANMGWEDD